MAFKNMDILRIINEYIDQFHSDDLDSSKYIPVCKKKVNYSFIFFFMV